MIKEDICGVFSELHSLNFRGFRKLNEALITLLFKKADAVSLFNYRLISLIHLIVKLFVKPLSLRLASHLSSMVSINRSSFIASRSIHDNFLLVQQMARLLHYLKANRMLLRLDIPAHSTRYPAFSSSRYFDCWGT